MQLTPTISLGAEQGPGTIEQLESRAVQDSRGRYYVVGSYSTQIKVFGPTGNFLRVIGRRGQGPGEYQGIAKVIVGPGDSLFILDQVGRRYTVLNQAYQTIRTVRLPFGPQLESVRLRDGSFVINLPLRTPGRIGKPLHVISAKGELVRSMGSTAGPRRPDIPFLDDRSIAVAQDNQNIWSSYVSQYQVDLIEPVTGSIRQSLVRDVDWFPSRLRSTRPPSSGDPPPPMVMAIQQDHRGVLWVIIAVADSAWRTAVVQPKPGERDITITDDQRYYDTVIEAIDPVAGTVLATRRLPEFVDQFVGDNLVGKVLEDAAGAPRLQLWRLTLNRP